MNKKDLYFGETLNNDYHSGYIVLNKRLNKRGTVTGCFLGNDRKTPRYKVRKEGAIIRSDTSDWNVDECTVVQKI
jgi:hypothetical protein